MMFLLYATKQEQRTSPQYNSCLVVAATEEAARIAAKEATPYGGIAGKIDRWAAVEIIDATAIGATGKTVCWFQGRGPVSLLSCDSGGNPVD
jgi:hypothetical protein